MLKRFIIPWKEPELITKKYKNNKIYLRKNTMDLLVLTEQKLYMKNINLDKKDIWLDAGAHIGTFSLSIHEKVDKIICYEPNNDNFYILEKNIKKNSIKNVVLNNLAIVGNLDKQRYFYLNKRNKKNTGGHSFYIKRKPRERTICECININKILQDNPINKIKMDVEGAEYEILKAIKPDFFKNIEEIIFEYHFNILKDHPECKKHKEIINLLKKHFSYISYKENIEKLWFTLIYCKK